MAEFGRFYVASGPVVGLFGDREAYLTYDAALAAAKAAYPSPRVVLEIRAVLIPLTAPVEIKEYR